MEMGLWLCNAGNTPNARVSARTEHPLAKLIHAISEFSFAHKLTLILPPAVYLRLYVFSMADGRQDKAFRLSPGGAESGTRMSIFLFKSSQELPSCEFVLV